QAAFGLDLFALKADVGDPVLAATIRAAGDVQLELLIEFGKSVLEFLDKPARERLRFGDSDLAELGAGAGDGAAPEGGTSYRQSSPCELRCERATLVRRNVHDEQVLHVGRAQLS